MIVRKSIQKQNVKINIIGQNARKSCRFGLVLFELWGIMFDESYKNVK